MVRRTSSFSMQVPITIAVKILDKNPYRLLYSIQNVGAQYIAIGPNSTVTAGLYGLQEGQHLTAGQPMSDDTDQAEVWAVADTAPVNISVIEISELPKEDNPRVRELRPKEPRELRRETRTF